MLQIQRTRTTAPAFIPDFSDPLGLLVHCHAKLEAQFRALESAVRVLREGGAEVEALRAIEAAQAHFAGPGVKHTADEEESLFPRLRRYAGSEVGVLDALAELQAQHRTADRAHAEFDALVERMRRGSGPTGNDVDEIGERVEEIVTLYGPHIALENDVIFPAAARVLPPAEIAGLGEEMRERRRGMVHGSGARPT
jgi:pyridoxamine 5'-phosphate oxidase